MGSRRMQGNFVCRHFAIIERSGQKCNLLIVVIYVPCFLSRNRTGELFFSTNRTGGTEAEIAPTTHNTFTSTTHTEISKSLKMIQSSTKPITWSLLIPPSSLGPRSSSVGSTTSVVDCKESLDSSFTSCQESEDPSHPIKKVQFNQTVRAKLIPSHDRLSKRQRSRIWYNSEECMAIRESAMNTVRRMTRDEAVDLDSNDSSRGLEGRTPRQDRIRQARKQIITLSVLTEQLETQQYDYETSSQAISEAYALCNRTCSREAVRRGELDAKEANHS